MALLMEALLLAHCASSSAPVDLKAGAYHVLVIMQ